MSNQQANPVIRCKQSELTSTEITTSLLNELSERLGNQGRKALFACGGIIPIGKTPQSSSPTPPPVETETDDEDNETSSESATDDSEEPSPTIITSAPVTLR